VRTPWDGQKGFWAAWNRFFYLFEGPAQLGTADGERPRVAPEERACPLCGRPMGEHAFDRSGPGGRTLMTCPGASGPAA